MKKLITSLIALTLLLAACSAASSPSQPELLYAPEPGGGEVYVEEVVEAEAKTLQVARDPIAQDSTVETGERLVIKNADLSIAVKDPLETMQSILNLADQMGGFVVSSNLYYTTLENGAEVPQADVTIRVPADRLDEALAKIESGAGRILSKNISGQDVTQEYTDLQSRLRNLQEAETQLQQIMDEAKDTEDVLNVYNQLVNIREQIEIIQGRIQYFEQSAAFSAISVIILADEAVQPITIGGWQPVGVAKDAIQALLNTLTTLANAAIWLALYVLPVLVVLYIPARLIWAAIRRWRASQRQKTAAPPAADR